MMEKLKLFIYFVIKNILKQEAIKEVKCLQKVEKALNQNNKDRLVEGKWCQMISFFNLTEEELK